MADYVMRRLDPATVEAFEPHYFDCASCFEELGVTELIVSGLRERRLDRRQVGGVTLLSFEQPAELTYGSRELEELVRNVFEQPDSKVAIDMSRVSRIDSSGLGELMRLHAHLVLGRGALKVVNPSEKVESMLKLTRINAILETYCDEESAVASFGRTPEPPSG